MPFKQLNEPEISGHASIGADKKSAWLRRLVPQRNWRAEIAQRLPHRNRNAITKLNQGSMESLVLGSRAAMPKFILPSPIKSGFPIDDLPSANSVDSGYGSLDSNATAEWATEWASEWACETRAALRDLQDRLIEQPFNLVIELKELLVARSQHSHDVTCLGGTTRTSDQVIRESGIPQVASDIIARKTKYPLLQTKLVQSTVVHPMEVSRM